MKSIIRNTASATLALGVAGLTSCGHVREKSQAYVPMAPTSANVNGAQVVARLDPVGAGNGVSLSAMIYFAAAVKTEGPYQLVVAARGVPGDHQWLEIKSLQFTTASGKTETMAPSYHNAPIFFEETSRQGVSQAVYRSPLDFEADWNTDGAVSIDAQVVVASGSRRIPARIVQTFEPQETKETEFINVPLELGRSLFGSKEGGFELIE